VSTVLVSIYICFGGSVSHRELPTALKADDIAALKSKVNFPPDQTFYVPKETYEAYAATATRGAKLEQEWNSLFAAYKEKYPKEHAELSRRIAGELPKDWEKALPVYKITDAAQASRKLSEIAITALTPVLPDLIGGSADLTGSNLTRAKGVTDFQHPSTGLGNYSGVYIRYGVREHAMGAIANGLAAYGGIIPFIGTFLVRECLDPRIRSSDRLSLELRLLCCWCRQTVCSQQTPSHLGRHS
jgi:transketolase